MALKLGQRVTWVRNVPATRDYKEYLPACVVNTNGKDSVLIKVPNNFGKGYLYRWVKRTSLVVYRKRKR